MFVVLGRRQLEKHALSRNDARFIPFVRPARARAFINKNAIDKTYCTALYNGRGISTRFFVENDIHELAVFFSGEGGGSEVGGVDQGATARSTESAGLLPAEACWESAVRRDPRAGDVLRRPQIRAGS